MIARPTLIARVRVVEAFASSASLSTKRCGATKCARRASFNGQQAGNVSRSGDLTR